MPINGLYFKGCVGHTSVHGVRRACADARCAEQQRGPIAIAALVFGVGRTPRCVEQQQPTLIKLVVAALQVHVEHAPRLQTR